MDQSCLGGCPEFVVYDVPFHLRQQAGAFQYSSAIKAKSTPAVLLPVLVVTNGTRLEMPVEVLKWARSQINNWSYKKLRNSVAVIGRLYVFKAAFPDFAVEDAEDVELLINAYLFERVASDAEPSKRLFSSWKPVSIESAEEDFRAIRSFANYCRSALSSQAPFAQALALTFFSPGPVGVQASRRQHFFTHLRQSYARWLEIVGSPARFPNELKRSFRSFRKSGKKYRPNLTFENVCSIIDAEKNPVFKAVWIILFFGGRRISEVLNLWCAGVLSGHSRSEFCNIKCSSPLILVCDPLRSTYTGDLSKLRSQGKDRRSYMVDRYGRLPRYEVNRNPKARAGSKGFLVLNEELNLSWVTWITNRYHEEFYRLMQVIEGFNREARAIGRHPYFFINCSRRTEKFGDVLTYSRVLSALSAAFSRVGLKIDDYGKKTHVGRNFYTWYARNILSVSEEILQIMLLHTSVYSQKDYGRDAAKTHSTVTSLTERMDHELRVSK